MRILILGGAYISQALKSLGHQVFNVGSSPYADYNLTHPITSAKLLERAHNFSPEAICYLDDGNLPFLIDPENLPCPAIYYSIDTYCNPWHAGYANGFDHVLVAQKDFLPLFQCAYAQCEWFPLFSPDGTCAKQYGEGLEFCKRDIPVCFVGSLDNKNNPDRADFVKRFKSIQPIFIKQGDFRPIFTRSAIVLNQTAFSELNFRCFEAIRLGAALLMENCGNGLEDIFTPGENILPLYPRNNAAAAAGIVKQWLSQPDMLASVAKAGQNLVAEKHSAAARAQTLEKLIISLLNRPINRLALVDQRKPFVRNSFGMLAADLTDPKMAKYRDFYMNLAQA